MTPTFWIGVCENNDDKELRGRIQVRIFGVHDMYSTKDTQQADTSTGTGLPTDDLPWAICVYPVTFGGTKESTCPPPAVLPGAWVFGVSLDGDFHNELVCLGVFNSYKTMSDFAKNEQGGSTTSLGIGVPQMRSAMQEPENNMPEEQPEQEYKTMTFAQLSSAIALAESGGDPTKTNGSKFGLFQIHPVQAAKILVQNEALLGDYIKKTDENGNPTTQWAAIQELAKIEYDKSIGGFPDAKWRAIKGSDDFTKTLLVGEFNKAIGNTMVRECLRASNGDAVLAAVAYNQGPFGLQNCMQAAGSDGISLPSGQTYTQFLNTAQSVAVNGGQNNLYNYVTAAFANSGGMRNIDAGKRVMVEG